MKSGTAPALLLALLGACTQSFVEGDGGVRDGSRGDSVVAEASTPRETGPGLRDGGGWGSREVGPPPPEGCPVEAPNPDFLGGPCCSGATHAGRRNKELRVSALAFRAPASLTSPALAAILQGVLDDGSMNWLLLLETGESEESGGAWVRSGDGQWYGHLDTYAFAPPDTEFESRRWPLSYRGGAFRTDPESGSFKVAARGEVEMVLPVRQFGAYGDLDESTTCVGVRTADGYDTSDGTFTFVISIDDARAERVRAPGIDTSLCNLLRGASGAAPSDDCADVPRASWDVKPEALCSRFGCAMGACDPESECDAWVIAGEFAAQGVEIID